jgi:hypothetical protein
MIQYNTRRAPRAGAGVWKFYRGEEEGTRGARGTYSRTSAAVDAALTLT